jgi:hypothetical protein
LPDLDILHPLNATWWNSDSILIEGTTEPDATITIEGEMVPNILGSFTFPLSLEQGNRSIKIIAVDLAGNHALQNIVLFIDWTPPVLTRLEIWESLLRLFSPSIQPDLLST